MMVNEMSDFRAAIGRFSRKINLGEDNIYPKDFFKDTFLSIKVLLFRRAG